MSHPRQFPAMPQNQPYTNEELEAFAALSRSNASNYGWNYLTYPTLSTNYQPQESIQHLVNPFQMMTSTTSQPYMAEQNWPTTMIYNQQDAPLTNRTYEASDNVTNNNNNNNTTAEFSQKKKHKKNPKKESAIAFSQKIINDHLNTFDVSTFIDDKLLSEKHSDDKYQLSLAAAMMVTINDIRSTYAKKELMKVAGDIPDTIMEQMWYLRLMGREMMPIDESWAYFRGMNVGHKISNLDVIFHFRVVLASRVQENVKAFFDENIRLQQLIKTFNYSNFKELLQYVKACDYKGTKPTIKLIIQLIDPAIIKKLVENETDEVVKKIFTDRLNQPQKSNTKLVTSKKAIKSSSKPIENVIDLSHDSQPQSNPQMYSSVSGFPFLAPSTQQPALYIALDQPINIVPAPTYNNNFNHSMFGNAFNPPPRTQMKRFFNMLSPEMIMKASTDFNNGINEFNKINFNDYLSKESISILKMDAMIQNMIQILMIIKLDQLQRMREHHIFSKESNLYPATVSYIQLMRTIAASKNKILQDDLAWACFKGTNSGPQASNFDLLYNLRYCTSTQDLDNLEQFFEGNNRLKQIIAIFNEENEQKLIELIYQNLCSEGNETQQFQSFVNGIRFLCRLNQIDDNIQHNASTDSNVHLVESIPEMTYTNQNFDYALSNINAGSPDLIYPYQKDNVELACTTNSSGWPKLFAKGQSHVSMMTAADNSSLDAELDELLKSGNFDFDL